MTGSDKDVVVAPSREPEAETPLALLALSYDCCRAITRKASSSFPIAFRLLPSSGRRAMETLYAFMRVTDDLVDRDGEAEEKRTQLRDWKLALDATLSGRYSHPVHAALHDVVRRFHIPHEYLDEVIDGVEMDLESVRFATFDDLYAYCYRVASAVGLACVRIWNLRPGVEWAEAAEPAEAAGIAFQLTNILRDLGEDQAQGRIYIPQAELDRFECPPTAWRDPTQAARFRDMMRFQIERARKFYREGDRLNPMLSRDGRAIFRVMSGSYRRLLDEIERRGYDVFTTRVRVSRCRKLALFASAWPVKWGIL